MIPVPRLTMSSACCRAAAALGVLALAATARAEDANVWSRASAPTETAPAAIGSPSHGCLAGARRLPPDGVGYEIVHLSRRRNYGLPETVDFVERLGSRAAATGLPVFYVGDMAQPRGGPLPFGHASHQIGVDVDIWFTFAARHLLVAAAREDIALPSMLKADWRTVDPRRFGTRQVALLRLAATDTRVDRIFVNPVIKTTLCRILPRGDHAWLRRLRPWWGHDDHFHVRLSCPAGSTACKEPEAAIPSGDGCDAVLASWVRDQRPPPPHPAPAPRRPLPKLPAQCQAILAAP
jgi:penicillin-insensitive murein DD-endopeptidase